MKQSIGIVLSSTPNYSETFFVNTINGLINKGYTVTLYVDSGKQKFNLCKVVKSPSVPNNKIIASLKITINILFFIIFYYNRYIKFIEAEKEQGATMYNILKKLYKNLHILKAKELDWLHFGFSTLSIGRENISKVINAKMAISLRGFDISIYPKKKPGCYHHLWPNINKVHSISNDLLNEAYKEGMLEGIPYQIINPAIDIQLFLNNSFKNTNLKQKNCIKILTVSRLHWKKGLDYTIDALRLLHLSGLKFEYTIVGDGVEYEKLVFSIHQLELNSKINLCGKISHNHVRELMKESDIYLQYSIQEGFCNAVLEAQAMGLLCIVSDAEGLPENILHEQTGWVVPKRRPDLLAQKIEEVIALPEEVLLNIRINAVERVRSQFNIDKQIEEFVKFYSNDV